MEREAGREVVWRPLAGIDGLWHAEKIVDGVPLRSTAVRLADGRLAVYSPIRGLGADAYRELGALGRPALLVAPNHFHNRGLREYGQAYPEAAVVASATARPRIARIAGCDVGDDARLREALPAHVAVLVPPATRAGELWLSAATPDGGRAWMVGDAFFNIARTPRTPIGLLLRLLGISPGLRIGSSFRWLIRDRAAYRRWLEDTLAAERPSALIPCHGEVLADAALADRLRRLIAARL